jgi:hypothetical protein
MFIYTLGVKSSRLLLYPTRSHPHTTPTPYYPPPICFPLLFFFPSPCSQCFNRISSRTLKTRRPQPPLLHLSIHSHFTSSPPVKRTHSMTHALSTVHLGKLRLKLIMSKIYFPCKIYSSCSGDVTRRSDVWQCTYSSPRVLSETLCRCALYFESSITLLGVSVSLSCFVTTISYSSWTELIESTVSAWCVALAHYHWCWYVKC